MSDQQGGNNPDRVEIKVDGVMTNHIHHSGKPEHVNGGNVPAKPTLAQLGRQDSMENINTKPKPSTFKITSVTLHPQKGSSQDGRHSYGEDDEESAVEDSLGQTDVEESPAPPSNFTEIVKGQARQTGDQQRQDRVDSSSSRFKVVKIQKREPYSVGRWRISDVQQMSESEVNTNKVVGDVTHTKRSDSGNSSRASSTHYVHGVDDPSKNPLASINPPNNLPSIQQSPLTQSAGIGTIHIVDNASNSAPSEPTAHPHVHVTDHIDNNSSRPNGDTGLGYTSAKDPHLIGTQTLVSNQQQPNSGAVSRPIASAGAPLVNSSTPLHHGISSSDASSATAAAQLNTQNVPQASSTPNVASAGIAAANVPVSTGVTGSTSEGQSTQGDNHQASSDKLTEAPTRIAKSVGPGESVEITGGVETLVANLTELVDPSATAADGEKAEDADATATGVAIDNKIEQAMDLVKSHLMLAVREEVEDLKLQIKQLLERNNQLEQENKLLRSSAAPETMAQLALLNRQQNH